MHPPAAGTALVTCGVSGPEIVAQGLGFVAAPVFTGSVVLVIVGVLTQNVSPGRRYPKYWV
jgi:CBS-domain-containing membrane protein